MTDSGVLPSLGEHGARLKIECEREPRPIPLEHNIHDALVLEATIEGVITGLLMSLEFNIELSQKIAVPIHVIDGNKAGVEIMRGAAGFLAALMKSVVGNPADTAYVIDGGDRSATEIYFFKINIFYEYYITIDINGSFIIKRKFI